MSFAVKQRQHLRINYHGYIIIGIDNVKCLITPIKFPPSPELQACPRAQSANALFKHLVSYLHAAKQTVRPLSSFPVLARMGFTISVPASHVLCITVSNLNKSNYELSRSQVIKFAPLRTLLTEIGPAYRIKHLCLNYLEHYL